MALARVLRLLVPPIVPALLDRLRTPERAYYGPAWPKTPDSWDDPAPQELTSRNWPALARTFAGTEPLSRSLFQPAAQDLTTHNITMTTLYVLARAARGKDRLSVLDWGGSAGQYAVAAQRMLPEIALDWTVKELPPICAAARGLHDAATFVDNDDAAFARSYDMVIANGSVHYAPDWQAMMLRLMAACGGWLLINGLPVVRQAPGFVVVQQLRSLGFRAPLHSNVVNRDAFVKHVTTNGFALEREFMAWGPVGYRGASEVTTGAGFLFRKSERHL